jgi:hypothetical protein
MNPLDGDELCLDVLGTSIGVPGQLADEFEGLARSLQPPVDRVTFLDPGLALADLTLRAITHSPLLCIHAGVVSSSSGVIAIPGASGLGKTTLSAVLVQAGYGYLSDESLALDRGTGHARPFARPLALNADVWPILGSDLAQVVSSPPAGTERLVPAARLGRIDAVGGPVAHILLAQRQPGPVRIEPAPRGDAVQALLSKSFNHYRAPESSFRLVVAVVRQAQVWRVSYAEAPELAAALADVVGQPSPVGRADVASQSRIAAK